MTEENLGRLRAYLDDELDPEARTALEAELDASAALRAALVEVRALGDQVDTLLGRADGPGEVSPDWDRFVARGQPRRWSPTMVAAAAVATLVAAALVMLWMQPFGATVIDGTRSATARQTVHLGSRGVAVVEAGAELQWHIEQNGDARVRHRRGAVFYRVQPGGAFTVQTPAGVVEVTGTCFSLEVVPMKEWNHKHGLSAAAGAIAGAALMLTVNEGTVVLANEGERIEVGAGGEAHVIAGSAPRRGRGALAEPAPPGANETMAELRSRDAAQRRRIAELEQQLAKDADRGGPTTQAQIRKCANSIGSPMCSTVDTDPAVLEEMARCGSIKVDMPEFVVRRGPNGYAPSAELAALVNLTQDEVAAITEANRKFAERYAADLRSIVTDLNNGEAPPVPPEAPPWESVASFSGVVAAALPTDTAREIRRAIAGERAGLSTAPQDWAALPPVERYERTRASVGDTYEAALAEVLGADRAHELRVAKDGWDHQSLFGGDCPDDGPGDDE